jgi:putative heme iron utilization protein
MHDFLFHRIGITQARFIGGFGNIHWLSGSELRPPDNQLAQQEQAILDHMNADHADSLIACCRHVHGVDAAEAVMVGIDTDGFDVRADGRILRFSFETPVTNAQEARAALVALSRQAQA